MDEDDLLGEYVSACLDGFEADCDGRDAADAGDHAEDFVREYATRFENTLRYAVQVRADTIRWRREQEEDA